MKKTHVHFMGIGGSGISAVAAIAQSRGFKISGCDSNPQHNEFTKEFIKDQLFTQHSKMHLQDIDILAVTPAIFSMDPNNEELTDAYKKDVKVITWQQFMGQYLQKDKFVVAICGTHGKSTTTAMVGLMLEDAGLDPTVELGAVVPRWRTNYRAGRGKYFISEADEFNDNFLAITPDITLVTTIEMDHPEYFHDFKEVKQSFEKFLHSTKLKIIANLSDKGVAEVVQKVRKSSSIECMDYSIKQPGLGLKVPGAFNQLNSAAVFNLGLELGIPEAYVQRSLESFAGIGRRFEFLGKRLGVLFFSDFAHHPTEIKVTIEAARQKFKKNRLWVLFQPHMFSRTQALFDDFVKVFRSLPANQIVITDIYAAREKDRGRVNSKQLVEAVNRQNVIYNSQQQLKGTLKNAKKGDVIFFMGAGDIDGFARAYVR